MKTLRLQIDRFAGAEMPTREVAFDVVMHDIPAESARLEMIDLPGRALCYDCMTTTA